MADQFSKKATILDTIYSEVLGLRMTLVSEILLERLIEIFRRNSSISFTAFPCDQKLIVEQSIQFLTRVVLKMHTKMACPQNTIIINVKYCICTAQLY